LCATPCRMKQARRAASTPVRWPGRRPNAVPSTTGSRAIADGGLRRVKGPTLSTAGRALGRACSRSGAEASSAGLGRRAAARSPSSSRTGRREHPVAILCQGGVGLRHTANPVEHVVRALPSISGLVSPGRASNPTRSRRRPRTEPSVSRSPWISLDAWARGGAAGCAALSSRAPSFAREVIQRVGPAVDWSQVLALRHDRDQDVPYGSESPFAASTRIK